MTPEPILLYITTSSFLEATRLAELMVQRNLVACVNLPQTQQLAIFRWQGQVEQTQEQLMFAKTTTDLLPAIQEFLQVEHSYECPCLVALPIVGGNPEFLDWIVAETHPSREPTE